MIQPTRRNDALLNYRLSRGWTQWEVAKMCGVDVGKYQDWEWGRKQPDPIYIGRLCSIFHVTLDKLGYQRHGRSA